MPIQLLDGHLFVEISGERWLFDTGAPTSFGPDGTVRIMGQTFAVGTNYLGLTSADLSRLTRVQCVGLVGTDVIGNFDWVIDIVQRQVAASDKEMALDGHPIELDDFLGIPILTVQIGGNTYQMIFDSGAQLSYFQSESLNDRPSAERMTDFYPGLGEFETETHMLEFSLGPEKFSDRFGRLPGLLDTSLTLTGTRGIIGNHFMADRVVAYFPRRSLLII